MIYTCLQCNRRLRIRPENKKHGHTFRCPHCKTQQWLIINWFSKRLSLENPIKKSERPSLENPIKSESSGSSEVYGEKIKFEVIDINSCYICKDDEPIIKYHEPWDLDMQEINGQECVIGVFNEKLMKFSGTPLCTKKNCMEFFLKGYKKCAFCLQISSIGVKDEYYFLKAVLLKDKYDWKSGYGAQGYYRNLIGGKRRIINRDIFETDIRLFCSEDCAFEYYQANKIKIHKILQVNRKSILGDNLFDSLKYRYEEYDIFQIKKHLKSLSYKLNVDYRFRYRNT